MLELNTKKVYLNEKEIASMQPKINLLFKNNLLNKEGIGNEFMDWIDYPETVKEEVILGLEEKVNQLKTLKVNHLLVIGIGGSFLGAQSAIDFLEGKLASRDKVLFIGTDMSSSYYSQMESFLENKEFAICVISKSGGTLEPSLAFNFFSNKLKEKHGSKANDYIVAITGNKGILKDFTIQEKITSFEIPNGIGGRFSVMTPVGMFPMIFVGINVREMLEGAKEAKSFLLKESSLEKNTALRYAVIRFLLNQNQKDNQLKITHEIFTTYDYDLEMLAEWWKQLFGESEGKVSTKGIFPLSVHYSRDLHSLGQIIQEGPKTFFETTLIVKDNSQKHITFVKDINDGMKINYLNHLTLEEINQKVFEGVLEAHYQEGGISNIIIQLKEKTPKSLGYLYYWFFISVTISGYLLDINPFDQPGVEIYKKNIKKNLSD